MVPAAAETGARKRRRKSLKMVSIVQRNNRYNVVYLYDDEATGKRKQKWESFKTMADAKRRKAEIEYRQGLGTMVIHQCKTVSY